MSVAFPHAPLSLVPETDNCTTNWHSNPTSSALFSYPPADNTSDTTPKTPTSMPTLANQTGIPGLAPHIGTAAFGVVMKQAQTAAAKAVFARLQSYLPELPSPSALWTGAGETASAYYSGASSMAKTGFDAASDLASSAYSATADWTGEAMHKGFDASMTYGACAADAVSEHPWMAMAGLAATAVAGGAGLYYMSGRQSEEASARSTKKPTTQNSLTSKLRTLKSVLKRNAGLLG
ncbi:uncharacterized protein MKK02DRAFT_41291 [Dioszegia hungarica]|uniref:Uncharacterized protein n=1 Tax=Dioszegia hungarica TaxID=4972 RepID=A0AA38H016_9TREE|nr:uncharacterized protein MKK02DRAFT_41291 [Dioszegia hungarica]KAI9632147.1 hypothetical protein MKK02DRAFT_41291 [Dioszegia hungarica]